MSDSDLPIRIGRLEAQIHTLAESVRKLAATVDGLVSDRAKVRGAWWLAGIIVAFITAAATLGPLFVRLFQNLGG